MPLFSESFSKLLVSLKTATNPKRHCSVGLNKVKVLKISPDSKNNDNIIQFMRQHFPDEPLNRAFGLTPEDDLYKFLEQKDLRTIKDVLSVKAVDSQTGQVWSMHVQIQGDPDLSLKLKDVTKGIKILLIIPVDSCCTEVASVGALD